MKFLRIAWHGAYRRRGRLILVGLPTAVMFGIVVFLINVEYAMHGLANDEEERRTLRIGSPMGEDFLTLGDVERLKRVPHVVEIGVEDWTGSVKTQEATGADPFHGGAFNPTLMRQFASNVFYVPPDALEKYKASKDGILIGKVVAERHGWKAGDTISLTALVGSRELPASFKVVYVADRGEMLDVMIFREGYLEELAKTPTKVLTTFVVVDDVANLDSVRKGAAEIFQGRALESLELTLADTKSYVRRRSSLMLTLFRATGIVAMAMLLTMTLATVVLTVEERRRELATLRAIGFSRGHIGALVIAEGVLLVLPGVLVGTLAMYLYYHDKVIQFGEWTRLTVDWRPVVLAWPFGLLLAALGALVPAIRAMRMPVLSSLRDD